MTRLRSLFGPPKSEIWSEFAEAIGGEFLEGGFWKADRLFYRHGVWDILLDTYTVSTGQHSITYTRIRAPFQSLDNMRFKLYHQGFFSEIAKKFGVQDIEIEDQDFDDAYMIKGNQPHKIRKFLSEPRLKDLIQKQPKVFLAVKKPQGTRKNRPPEDVNQLFYQCTGVLKDKARLESLFELFSLALVHLVKIGSASDRTPNYSYR